MKDIFDRVIETLELERELGTRTITVDRALLVPPKAKVSHTARADSPAVQSAIRPEVAVKIAASPAVASPIPARDSTAPVVAPSPTMADDMRDVGFWTDSPLSPAGAELLDKMIAAMHYTRAQVRVNEEGPVKTMVFMGRNIVRARAPEIRPVLGAWTNHDGVPTVITYSPDFIVKTFSPGSEGMRKAKLDVWHTLQGVCRRLGRTV